MASDEAIRLLRSIDASLKDLVSLSRQRLARPAQAQGATPLVERVATDREMDGPHGDPVIKAKDPRDWTGPDMKGRHLSECPAEYLDLYAERLEFFAQKAADAGECATNGKPKADYLRLDARRARGWAKRVREGRGATPAAAEAQPDEWPAEEEWPA